MIFSHRYSEALKYPSFFLFSCSKGLVANNCIASVNSEIENGFTSIAAFLEISGKDVAFDKTTGSPEAKASTTGSPKPSCREGNTNIPAPL